MLAYGADDLRRPGAVADDVRSALGTRAPELLARAWASGGRPVDVAG